MIARVFDVGITDFSLTANSKDLGPDENDTLVKEIGFNVIYVMKKNEEASSELHPKNILLGNQEFFNLMFSLLSHDEEYDVDNIWKLLMKLPQNEVPTAK